MNQNKLRAFALMRDTTLSDIADKMGLPYAVFARKVRRKSIDPDWLKQVVDILNLTDAEIRELVFS